MLYLVFFNVPSAHTIISFCLFLQLWHYLLEMVTTGHYPFPRDTNIPVSDDEKKQKKNSGEWKFFWICRGTSLFEMRSAVSEAILTRGWRPGRDWLHGLQRRTSPLPCSFGHALTNPLAVYITAIPREAGNDDLVHSFDSLSNVIKNHVTVLPLEPDQNAQHWNAFAIFESKNDYDSFHRMTRRVDGVELATSTPIPWVEDSIRDARAKVDRATVLLEGEQLSGAKKALGKAQRGLRMFWKRSAHYRDGHVMCSFSEEFLKLRNAKPSTYFEPELDEIMEAIEAQSTIIRMQEKVLARHKKIDDSTIFSNASDRSSTTRTGRGRVHYLQRCLFGQGTRRRQHRPHEVIKNCD
jgi:predicted metal-dependent hydrolase